MIDNLEKIKPLLTFESSDNFYFLQVIQRKKENKIKNNSNVVKNYYINSIQQLEDLYPEIKNLCDTFNARACIRLNKRSYEQVALKTLSKMIGNFEQRNYNHMHSSYDRCCGKFHKDVNKKWLLDIDFVDTNLANVKGALNFTVFWQNIAEIPSKSGVHLITTPFNTSIFETYCNKVGIKVPIHKDNPTNLYIP